ncbi:MAG: hypothetical protein KJ749_07975, partial [Planctomycetes bacterium]|nr:hypothetical protein [Planctomycetota bacterium]
MRTSSMLFVSSVIIGCSALRSWAVNETPKRTNAIYFTPFQSGMGSMPVVQRYTAAENYSFSAYNWDEDPLATLDSLRTIATGTYAVLVIYTHGSRTQLAVESFDVAADRDQAMADYRRDDRFRNLVNHMRAGTQRDTGVDRHTIELTKEGLKTLFGGTDSDRTILVIVACNSWHLQDTANNEPFGNTEFLGYNDALGRDDASRSLSKFLWRMGGPEGIPKRSVSGAYGSTTDSETGRRKMRHDGDGNTTLAPACTSHVPVNDAVLPLHVATDGRTIYETKMKAANT